MFALDRAQIYLTERMNDVGCCVGEDRWGSVGQKNVVRGYEKLSPQAQKSIVELLLNTEGVTCEVEQALRKAINDPKLVEKYLSGADFVNEAIKKELRENTEFAISLQDALNSKRAATYGLTYERGTGTIKFTKPNHSKKSIIPTGR
jgi:hypothetical protein